LADSGPGLAFWFHPLSTSIATIPLDDRELPFLFHERSRDFQDVTVQGTISFRVTDPERLAARVDFAIDLQSGLPLRQPMDKLASLLTELAQQFAWDYLAHTDLRKILENGVEAIRNRIQQGLGHDGDLEELGVTLVSVRVGAVKPVADVEKALQTPTREAMQQQADEATFKRRALAVEKERAIRENELQSEIELAHREENLIDQQGQNERRRATEAVEASRIEAEAKAARTALEAKARAESIALTEGARVAAEQERMAIYRDYPTEVLFGLAAQKLAGKLQRIEHLNLSPELLSGMLTNLMRAGTQRLEQSAEN
jgi:regulator of protease activity HflC (stomatin/prohibitin superfamily)